MEITDPLFPTHACVLRLLAMKVFQWILFLILFCLIPSSNYCSRAVAQGLEDTAQIKAADGINDPATGTEISGPYFVSSSEPTAVVFTLMKIDALGIQKCVPFALIIRSENPEYVRSTINSISSQTQFIIGGSIHVENREAVGVTHELAFSSIETGDVRETIEISSYLQRTQESNRFDLEKGRLFSIVINDQSHATVEQMTIDVKSHVLYDILKSELNDTEKGAKILNYFNVLEKPVTNDGSDRK